MMSTSDHEISTAILAVFYSVVNSLCDFLPTFLLRAPCFCGLKYSPHTHVVLIAVIWRK